jgi:hypothetical protein
MGGHAWLQGYDSESALVEAAPVEQGPETPSVAYKLAAIDGDVSEEAAFQAAIDCIMSSGIEGAETETKVGDTLVASWQQSGKQLGLLEWAQLLCTA